MGPISAGVRQLPYSEAIVAQSFCDAGGTHDIMSWAPQTLNAKSNLSQSCIRVPGQL